MPCIEEAVKPPLTTHWSPSDKGFLLPEKHPKNPTEKGIQHQMKIIVIWCYFKLTFILVGSNYYGNYL